MDNRTYSPWYYKINGQLVKKKKPCLPDQYVHVNKWDGAYRVYDVTVDHFVIKKNREFVNLPWSEFRCLKGEGDSEEAVVKRKIKALLTNNGIILRANNMQNELLKDLIKRTRK